MKTKERQEIENRIRMDIEEFIRRWDAFVERIPKDKSYYDKILLASKQIDEVRHMYNL